MRRALSTVLICLVALSWAAGFTARKELPPCCKVHGCTMMKRASRRCAFSRCDQNESATVSSQIIAVLGASSSMSPSETALSHPPLAARRSPLAHPADIDHPPDALA